MGVVAWLANLAAQPFADVARAVRTLWSAIRALWDVLVRIFHAAVNASIWLAVTATQLGSNAFRALVLLGRVMEWLATQYVPQMVTGAYHLAISALRAGLNDLRRWADAVVK